MSKLTRRDFLKLFSGNAVQAASRAIAAAVPPPSGTETRRKARSTRAPEAAEGATRCERCYAPFNPVAAETVCVLCLDSERKDRELMADALTHLNASRVITEQDFSELATLPRKPRAAG